VIAASRRAEALRAQVGQGGEFRQQAMDFAHLIAEANDLPPEEIVRRADALAAARWPGASEAALWLAEWLRRAKRFDEALERYADVMQRWPGTTHAVLAIRSAAGTALEAGDWDRAEELAEQLPAIEPMDRLVREDLLEAADRGRRRGSWYRLAWLGVLGGLVLLLGSLADASFTGGYRRPRLRPPSEVVFLLPVAAVLVGVSLTTHQLVAPAVLALCIGGLVLAYISGCALDTLRLRGRPHGLRSVLHAVISLVAVAAIFYIVMMRDDLLDMVIETVRFGPEP
jgi:hypothetical protein